MIRRDFMIRFGISAAALFMTRCAPLKFFQQPATGKARLRQLWMQFNLLAETTRAENATENKMGREMVAEHQKILDELVAAGELEASTAALVQEAYGAAVYHIWRSNAPITCYEPVRVDYAPTGAGVLVQQSAVLADLAKKSTIDPETLRKAQAALEHDMAFYVLSPDETYALYEEVIRQMDQQGGQSPAFDALDLEVTPEAKAAALFILELLTGQ